MNYNKFIKLYILFALLSLGCGSSQKILNEKTFIFSGQSNATNIGLDHVVEANNSNVTAWDGSNWIIAKNPMPGQMMNRVYQGISIWPSLGREYNQSRKIKVKLAGYANSGQTISHWNEGQQGWIELSNILRQTCSANTTFIWYQGESNSSIYLKYTYQNDLIIFLKRVIQLCPVTQIVVISLGDIEANYSETLGWDFAYIRNIQNQIPNIVPNTIVVKAEGYPLQDNVHLTSQSLIDLGKKIAQTIINAENNN